MNNINVKDEVLYITNQDGSLSCIPFEICNVEEMEIIRQFNEMYPDGRPAPEPSLEDLKANKINEIDLACKIAITGGFHSSAYQGLDKVYGSDAESQANLVGNSQAAMSKLLGIPGCENDLFYYHAQGEPEFYEWQAAECLQLARDFKIFKETQLFKCKTLQAAAMAAVDASDVNAISWAGV